MTIGRAVGATIRLAIGVGLVIWLVRTGAIDWAALRAFASAWPLVAVAQILLLAAFVATAVRLVVLFAPAGMTLSVGDAIQLSLVGTFFNLVLPGGAGGDVVRIWFATHGNAGRRAEVVAVMLLDRLVGMFALILWPLLALPFFGSVSGVPAVRALTTAAGVALAGMLGALAVVFSDRLRASALVRWTFSRLPFGGLAERIVDTVRAYRHRPGALLWASALSLLAHTFSIGATVVLAGVVLGEGFNRSVIMLIPLGFLANTLPLTPGGLGVGEAAFDRLFRLAGLSNGAVALIGWRLLSLVPAAMGLVVYLRGRRQFVDKMRDAQI
jgi:uncharacterized membrane protein YbhN (UPF0104 family)